jgi:hypothetical protein
LKLHSIKLVGEFKSLKGTEEQPFYLSFSQARDFYTPICLVGLNGSGKSNLIELVADILCYADRFYKDYYNAKNDLPYDFELRYGLNIDGQQTSIKLTCHNSHLTLQHNFDNRSQEPPSTV